MSETFPITDSNGLPPPLVQIGPIDAANNSSFIMGDLMGIIGDPTNPAGPGQLHSVNRSNANSTQSMDDYDYEYIERMSRYVLINYYAK